MIEMPKAKLAADHSKAVNMVKDACHAEGGTLLGESERHILVAAVEHDLAGHTKMAQAQLDDIPPALVRDQIALELGYAHIKMLAPADPLISQYADRLEAQAQRIAEFARAVRQGPSS
jgi:hypothetical protein